MPGPQHGYLHCSSNQSHDGTQTPNQPQTRTSVLAQETTLDRIFLLGLLAAILYVLWLPVFPTGDGPVHLYYADVLWSLVQHQPTYAHDYAIRHLLAPYLVHYLALVSFEHLVPPPMAEKLFIAIIFLTQALGFRFLARTLGSEEPEACFPGGEAPLACLWMLPLLFSWSLGGGFLNCCFATGVALWAYAVWIRLGHEPAELTCKAALLVCFIALLLTLVLSHPVPLMVLFLFTASDLLLRTLAHFFRSASKERNDQRKPKQQPCPAQLAALAMTLCAFLAPAMIAQKGQAAAAVSGIGFHRDVLVQLVSGKGVGLFASTGLHSLSGWIEMSTRAGLGIIVPGVAVLLRRANRQRAPRSETTTPPSSADVASARPRWTRALPATAAGRLLLICLLYLAGTLFFPLSLNHSYFFPQRMWNIVWLLVLACGAAAKPSRHARGWLALAALLLIALTAATSLPLLVRIAHTQQQLAAAPLPPGRRGLLLEPDSVEQTRGTGTTYPVYAWAGARAFAASHAILLNSPWLGLTILPIRDASVPGPHPLLDIGLPSIYSESPLALTHALATPSRDRTAILARADFLLYSNPASLASPHSAQLTLRAALALLGPESAAWQCNAPGFYAVCVRR